MYDFKQNKSQADSFCDNILNNGFKLPEELGGKVRVQQKTHSHYRAFFQAEMMDAKFDSSVWDKNQANAMFND